jgi:hypothetical protein
MNRRVQKLAVALLALSLSLNAPSAYAAGTRDGDWSPRSAYERVVKAVKKLLKPLVGASNEDTQEIVSPGPPKP